MNNLSSRCKIALTGLLIMVSMGCDRCGDPRELLPLQIYILKCDKSTKRLQLYRATYRRGFDSPVFDEQKTASGLNGKPWWVDPRTDKLLGHSKDPTDTTGGTM